MTTRALRDLWTTAPGRGAAPSWTSVPSNPASRRKRQAVSSGFKRFSAAMPRARGWRPNANRSPARAGTGMCFAVSTAEGGRIFSSFKQALECAVAARRGNTAPVLMQFEDHTQADAWIESQRFRADEVPRPDDQAIAATPLLELQSLGVSYDTDCIVCVAVDAHDGTGGGGIGVALEGLTADAPCGLMVDAPVSGSGLSWRGRKFLPPLAPPVCDRGSEPPVVAMATEVLGVGKANRADETAPVAIIMETHDTAVGPGSSKCGDDAHATLREQVGPIPAEPKSPLAMEGALSPPPAQLAPAADDRTDESCPPPGALVLEASPSLSPPEEARPTLLHEMGRQLAEVEALLMGLEAARTLASDSSHLCVGGLSEEGIAALRKAQAGPLSARYVVESAYGSGGSGGAWHHMATELLVLWRRAAALLAEWPHYTLCPTRELPLTALFGASSHPHRTHTPDLTLARAALAPRLEPNGRCSTHSTHVTCLEQARRRGWRACCWRWRRRRRWRRPRRPCAAMPLRPGAADLQAAARRRSCSCRIQAPARATGNRPFCSRCERHRRRVLFRSRSLAS